MAKIYTTCLLVLAMASVFMVFLNLWAENQSMFQKEMFSGAIGMGMSWFSLAIVLIGRMMVHGGPHFTPFNFNVILALAFTTALFLVAIVANGAAVVENASAVLIASAITSYVGGMGVVTMALAKRDEPAED